MYTYDVTKPSLITANRLQTGCNKAE